MVEEKTFSLGWPKIQCGRKVNRECEISVSEKFDAPKNWKGNGKGTNDHLGALADSKLISGQ